MTAKVEASGLPMTELGAINLAKGLTILCLISLAIVYGIQDQRQLIYLCLHVGYCLWWLFEQWLFPTRRQQIFTEKVNSLTVMGVLLFVGLFYALPGYFAFTNPAPISCQGDSGLRT